MMTMTMMRYKHDDHDHDDKHDDSFTDHDKYITAMAINSNELNTAEVAYASCNEVDKLQFVLHVKDIVVPEARNAEILLFRRR